MAKIIQLTLPEWVFLSGGTKSSDYGELDMRTVIMHVRTCSVFEILAEQDVAPEANVMQHTFTNYDGERLIVLRHFSPLLDDEDAERLIKKCAEFYVEYSRWEDNNILDDLRQQTLN